MNRLLAVLLVASSFQANAQSLSDPAPITRSLSVRQFGLPRDAQYIFCAWPACRERTVKTLAVPKMASAPIPSPLPTITNPRVSNE